MKLDYEKIIEAKKYIKDYERAKAELQQRRAEARSSGLFIFDEFAYLDQPDMSDIDHVKKMIMLLNNDKSRIEYKLREIKPNFLDFKFKEELRHRRNQIICCRKKLIELLRIDKTEL